MLPALVHCGARWQMRTRMFARCAKTCHRIQTMPSSLFVQVVVGLAEMRPFVINENDESDESPRSGRSDSSSEDAGKTHGDDTSKGNGKGKGVGKNNGNDSGKNKRKRQRQGKRQRLETETAERSETGHNMHVLITISTSCVQ